MTDPQISDDRLAHHHLQHELLLGAMPSKSSSSRHHPLPVYVSANTGTAISSVNGTLIIHVKADAHNYNGVVVNGDSSTTNDSNNNATTLNYEQLSREFYESYDPSVGLHTAAVLGGILVWLVLYLIYRTRVRKCIVGLLKKILVDNGGSEIKASDNEKESSSGFNPKMVRKLENPSIIIEVSPPQSDLQSSSPYELFQQCDQDCLSPYSVSETGNDDRLVFKFPRPGQNGAYHETCHCNTQCCKDHDVFIQPPKSEADIPSATARWVQSMPLAARSQQDFARLMLSLQSHGLLAMQKPCSCPLVCPRTPQPLPLLEMPNTWNKSLPVLSNSLSSQILSAYETVINNDTGDKDIKDIIKRELNNKNAREEGTSEYPFLCKKTLNIDSRRRYSHIGSRYDTEKIINTKLGKTPRNFNKNVYNSSENAHLINSPSFKRSPLPIPVTPTVTIQRSKNLYKDYRDYVCSASVSSNSSVGALLSQNQAPHIHISKPGYPRIPSPHLLSPECDSRSRKGRHHFSWSNSDIKRYHDNRDVPTSRPVSRHGYHQFSFENNQRNNHGGSNTHLSRTNHTFTRHRSLCDRSFTNNVQTQNSSRGSLYNCPSFSVSNYHSNFQLNSSSPALHTQRSLSADVAFSRNYHRDRGSPTCSTESNRNSIGTPSQSPYLLQVPDPNNLFRPVTPEYGANKYYTEALNNGSQTTMRHCVHSDGNIAYSAGHPIIQDEDNSILRRHSTYAVRPGEIDLSFCCDNTVRPTSSLGSSGTHNLSQFAYSHHPDQTSHNHHGSTGMLSLNSYKGQRCGLYSRSSLNRSYSAVVMETKL